MDPRPYKAALKLVQEIRPHIIHGAVFEGVAVAAIVGRLGRVPIIIGEETSDPKNRRWKGHLLYRGLVGLCHQMVAVSPAVVQYLEKKIFVPRKKISLIYNGVAEKAQGTPRLLADLRERLKIPQDGFVIGTVGRLFDDYKRVSDLIRAMTEVTAFCPNAMLLVVGGGPDEESLRALATELGLERRIIFAGYQSDTQPFYQLMDVFALASANEAFGLVLVEAMFSRLPVVATRVGGIPSIVRDGETGYLVEPYKPSDLAKAILRLQDDALLRRAMGGAGRNAALERFTSGRYVSDVDNLYRALLAARNVI